MIGSVEKEKEKTWERKSCDGGTGTRTRTVRS